MTQLGDYPRQAYKHFAAEACYDLSIAEDRRSNFDQAIVWLDKSKNFYDDIDDELGVLYAEVFQAWVYYDKGEVIQALEMAEEAKKELETMEEDLKDNKRFLKVYGNVLSDLGTYYKRIGESEKAIISLNQSLELRESLGDKDDIAEVTMNLGRVLYELKDFERALLNYERSLELTRQTSNISAQSFILGNRSQLYIDLKRFSEAERDLKESLAIRIKEGNKKGQATTYRKLGDLYFDQKKIKEAKVNFENSHRIFIEIGYPLGVGQSCLALSFLYEQMNNKDLEFTYADSAYKVLLSVKSAKPLLKAALRIQDLYKSRGMFAEALRAAEDVQWAQNQLKEEEAKDLLLKQEYQEKETSANRSVYFAIAGAVVLLIIAMLLLRAYRLRKKAQGLAEQQKELVEERNKNMVDSIQYAQQLQSAILPSPQLFEKNFSDHFLIYLPKDIVAGDFYWFYENEQYRLWAVADCTGHGVPGAMVSVVCSNALNRAVKEYNLFDPGEILTKTRELVVATFQESQREVKDGMDIALCCLEKQSGQITFSGANRPCWVVAEDGVLHEVKGQKQHIGLQQNMMAFESVSIQNKSGWIVLTSDGMADQFGGPQGKKWMTKTLKQKVSEMAQQPGHLQKMNLEWAFQQWRGAADQIDDVCVLGIKI
jgi:serine phosphatase RsbU (regulator of sigma subunit)